MLDFSWDGASPEGDLTNLKSQISNLTTRSVNLKSPISDLREL